MTDDVSYERLGQLGLITLNRPRALNALTYEMCVSMTAQLTQWRGDDTVRIVVLAGAGDRAFCAGGDVVAVRKAALELLAAGRPTSDPEGLPARFFSAEYRLNHLMHHYPKPIVTLAQGVCMGGGVGLAMHSRYRCFAPDIRFAMPETGIGLFTDVGGGWFLPRLPGEMGTYLGLTGNPVGAADCAYLGLASVIMPSDRFSALIAALAEERGAGVAPPAQIEAALKELAITPGAPALQDHRAAIDRCFAHGSAAGIIDALMKEGGSWATGLAGLLSSRSPTSMALTLALLRRGRSLDYDAIVGLEYRLAVRAVGTHDFAEGIRAALVDKDRNPQWQPDSLAAVTGPQIAAMFTPLDDRELVL